MPNKELQNILHFYASRKRHVKLNDCLKSYCLESELITSSNIWDYGFDNQLTAIQFTMDCYRKFYINPTEQIPNYFERMVENISRDIQLVEILNRFRPIGEALCMIEKFYKQLSKYSFETNGIYLVLKTYENELIKLQSSMKLNRINSALSLCQNMIDWLYLKRNEEEF